MPGNQITFGVGFNVNEAGLNKLKQSLQEIQKMTAKDAFATGNFSSLKAAETELNRIKQTTQQVQSALGRAFNSQLGTTNLTKFNAELSRINVGQLATQMNSLGATGQIAFLNLTKQALSLQAPLKQNYTWLTKIGQTLANSIKWNIASSVINGFTGSVQSAFNYVKALDASLTDIRIVTGQSREEMALFAKQANDAAQALGRQTKEYTNAALAFYQQGLSADEVKVRTETALKAQNVTGAGSEVVDQLTAVWNGYNVAIEETEGYVDKLAAVADSSATNLSELATGMSKVASTANNMGVTMDQLTAQLATIIATTRQAPETVGNALKTIYARINDIKSGSDEAEISLGNYTSKMASLGFSVLDANGKLKDTGQTMEEIGARWGSLTREQQIYLAQTMAGQRQMNNLIALFDNWQKYSDMLNVSLSSQGALNEKNARYMESLGAHINQFKAAVEGMQDALINEDDLSNLYDTGSKLVNLITNFIEGIGGMRGMLAGLGVIATSVFKNQIADSITTAINNLNVYNQRLQATKAQQEILKAFNISQSSFNTLDDNNPFKIAIGNLSKLRESLYAYKAALNETSQQAISGILEQKAAIDSEILGYEDLIKKATELGNISIRMQTEQGVTSSPEYEASKIFQADIGVESSSATLDSEQVQKLTVDVTVLKDSYADFKQMASDLSGPIREQARLKAEYDKTEQQIKELEAEAQKYKQAMTAAQKANNGKVGSEAWKEASANLRRVNQELDNLREKALDLDEAYVNSFNNTKAAMDQFKATLEGVTENNNIFGDSTARVRELIAQLGAENANNTSIIAELGIIFGESGDKAERYIQALKHLAQELSNTKAKAEETKVTIQNLKESLHLTALGQQFSGLVQGVSQLAMGIVSLRSALKTYKDIQDGTIDSMDGWLQIIMSVSMALPMLATGIKSLALGLPGLVGAIGKVVVGLGGLVTQATIVNGAVVATTGTVLAGIGVLTGVIAVIGGLIAAGVALYNHLTKASQVYKQAQKDLEEATKQADEAKNKYQELTSIIENYRNAEDALQHLTQGTSEFKEQLSIAVDQAAKLLEIMPELGKNLRYDKNGNPIFSNEDLEVAEQKYQRDVANAQITAAKAERRVANTRVDAEINSLNTMSLGPTRDIINDIIRQIGELIKDDSVLKVQLKEYFNDSNETYKETLKKYSDISQNFNATQDYIKQNKLDTSIMPNNLTDSEKAQFVQAMVYQDLMLTDLQKLGVDTTKLAQIAPDVFYQMGSLFSDILDNIDPLLESMLDASHQEQVLQSKLQLAFALELQQLTIDNKSLVAALLAYELALTETVDEQNALLDQIEQYEADAEKLQEGLTDAEIQAVSTFVGAIPGIKEGSLLELNQLEKDNVINFLSKNTAQLHIDPSNFDPVISAALEEWEAAWNEIFDHLPSAMIESFQSIKDMKIFNPQQGQKIAEIMKQAFIADYQNGLNIARDFFQLSDLQNLTSEQWNNILDALLNEDVSIDNVNSLLEDAGLHTSNFTSDLEKLINLLADSKTKSAFEEITERAKEAKEIADNLSYGKKIKREDYETLANYGVQNLDKQFVMTDTGDYEFRGKVSELQNMIDTINHSNLDNSLKESQQELDEFNAVLKQLQDGGYQELTQAENFELQGLPDKKYAVDLFNSGLSAAEIVQEYAKLAEQRYSALEGYGVIKPDSQEEQYSSDFTKLDNQKAIADLYYQWYNSMLKAIEEARNQTTNPFDIQKNAQARLDYLELLNPGNQEDQLQIAQWKTDLQSGDLETIKQAAQEIYDKFIAVGDQVEQLTQQAEASQEEVDRLKAAAEYRPHEFDSDVSMDDLEKRAEFLEDYGKELYGISQDLKNNHEAAMLIAEDFLRAEHAAKEVRDNIEDWRDALKNPTKDISKFIEALQDVDNAYKDLLNLSNDAHLSEEFLKSEENLQLMEDAVNGNTKAYDELVKAAQQDIVHQGIFDNEDGGFVLPEMDDSQLQALEESVMNHIAALQSQLDGMNLEIGAEIKDDEYIAALNEMINMAGLTADQATDLLTTMGIDAKVVEEPPETTTNPSSYTYLEPAEYTVEPVGDVGSSLGGTFPYYEARLSKEAKPVTKNATQADTSPASFAIHVENAKRGIGSGGNINHVKAGGSGGSGGKKGGGGGGGGNKAPKKKDPIKKFKSKIDPYHDVNIKIGNVQEGLDKLEKRRNKLLGKEAIDNLTKQINLMEKEKKLLQEKDKIAEKEQNRLGKELADLGVIFKKNGEIANYKKILTQEQNKINKAIEYCNTLEGDGREAYEKYINDLKEQYKELEEKIKEYDETVQLRDDLRAQYQDLIDQQIELAIEAFDLEINVKLDLKDAEKDFNEFRKKVVDKLKDDDFAGQAEATAREYATYYNVDENGIAGGLINDLRTHGEQIQHEIAIIKNGGFSQIYGDNLAAAAEDLKKYNDELMQALEEAQEIIDETHDHFLEAIDAMNDAFDTQQDNFDRLDDLLTHDMEILQLIHGEENYDEMDRLWNQQIAQDNARLEALQKEQEYWKERLNDYEEGTDEWKKAMENWQDAFEKTNDAMINAVQNLQTKWENSINSIMSKLKNTTYGGNMQNSLDDWDKMIWHSDKYLDNLERATGLLDLQGKFQDAINKTNDPKMQAQIAELEEKQLDALAEKEHLREIDLKIAQQQLTVLQAQMALEDAQQSKTKLRLRRDSQGNYTYQYVADEENIEAKKQEYINALADYRQMTQESYREDLQEMNDRYQEFLEKMQDAQMKYGDDTAALMEEQARLTEMYLGEDGYITRLALDSESSKQDALRATYVQAKGLNDLLEEDLFTKFLGPDAEVTAAINELLNPSDGEIPSLIEAFTEDSVLDAFNQISEASQDALFDEAEGLVPEVSTALARIADHFEDEFLPTVMNAMYQLQVANQYYVDGLNLMAEVANRDTLIIAQGLAGDVEYTTALNTATQDLLDVQSAQVESAERVYESLKQNEAAFRSQTAAAIDAANAMYVYYLALNGQVAKSLPYSLKGGFQTEVKTATPNTSTSNNNNNNNNNNNSNYSDSGASQSSNNNPHGFWANWNRMLEERAGARMATGGYTGDWGSTDPRLAWLDTKELVLKDSDTANILKAVDIVRDITDRVQATAMSAAAGLSNGSSLDLVAAAGQTVLQNVVINADFPAVQDAAQIKQAFNDLVNLASQRASGNRRTY